MNFTVNNNGPEISGDYLSEDILMNAVIIEDEPLAAEHLKSMIEQCDRNIKVLKILDCVQSSIEWLSENQADLIFLDIHLGDDDSFSIFKTIELNTPVIFVTAYDQYAIRAFKLNSLDYLLKPVQYSELESALNKFRKHHLNNSLRINDLMEALKEKPKYKERFMVVSGQKIRSIPISDISFFLSEGRYVKIVTKNNERFLIDQSMESVEKNVDPELFYRINRQVIVQYNSIKAMHAWSKSRIKIELEPEAGCDTIVSVDRSGDFKRWLNK